MNNEHYDNVNVQYKTNIEGWVATDGRFWGKDEHMARWTSCKYITCKEENCDNVVEKHWTRCSECRDKKSKDKWENSDKQPVSNEDVMYYSEKYDEYFQEWEDVVEFSLENNVGLVDMLLYHCDREKPPQVDVECLYEDITPDGLSVGDMVNDEIDELIDMLNKALKEHPVNCFYPSKIAVKLKEV